MSATSGEVVGPGAAAPASPSDDGGGDIPIALSAGPSASSPATTTPAAPVAGTARIITITRTQQLQQPQQREQKSRSRFLQVGPARLNTGPQRAVMPFMASSPTSPPSASSPTAVKWSRVRELRASIKPSRRVAQPLPSPSVHDGGEDEGDEDGQEEEQRQRTPVEAGKRKTLFQRALEGWWDLPGLLVRGDTVRARPGHSRRGERAGFV